MVFDLNRILRNASPDLLRRYIEEKVPDLLPCFADTDPPEGDDPGDERKRARRRAGAIRAEVDRLSDRRREAIYKELEQVEQLGTEPGFAAIRAALIGDRRWIEGLEALDSDLDRAFTAFLDKPELFQTAEDILLHDRAVGNDRQWSGFRGGKELTVQTVGEAMDAFKEDVSALFRKADGSGRHLQIDVFERGPRRPDDAEARARLVQLTVHVEALPTATNVFEGAELKRQVYRPALEVASPTPPLPARSTSSRRVGRRSAPRSRNPSTVTCCADPGI